MKVHSLYFSPTLTTRKVADTIAQTIASELSLETEFHDVTTPAARADKISFCKDDIVVFGCPVYIGRVPNLIKPYLETIAGGGAAGVALVVYGNRNYDDALAELHDLMVAGGFRCVGAAAFIGEHSFSAVLGGGRPDMHDLEKASDFGRAVAAKLAAGNGAAAVIEPGLIPGNRPARFFKAVDDDGRPFDIRKVKPVTDMSKCTGCGICAELCPMGSISREDFSSVSGICIKCGACVKRCPGSAKSFTDPEFLRHLNILERDFSSRREPSVFL